MNILVTGSGGFIGKSLIRALNKLGNNVSCLDICACPPSLAMEHVTWFQGSFIDENVKKIIDKIKPDVVIHLATTLFPNESIKDPVNDCFENLYKTLCFFESCFENDTKKIIYASSAGTIYGDSDGKKLSETSLTYPKVSYGATKLSVEHYLRILADKYNSSSISLRISNPFGEEQSLIGNQGVIPIFLNKIHKNEQIEVWGDINAKRDYIYIESLMKAFISAIDYSGNEREFNIGCGFSYSLRDIIFMIESTLNKKANVTIVNESFNKPKNIDLSIELAKEELLFEEDSNIKKHIESIARYHNFIN